MECTLLVFLWYLFFYAISPLGICHLDFEIDKDTIIQAWTIVKFQSYATPPSTVGADALNFEVVHTWLCGGGDGNQQQQDIHVRKGWGISLRQWVGYFLKGACTNHADKWGCGRFLKCLFYLVTAIKGPFINSLPWLESLVKH